MIGEWLKKERERLDLTQTDFGAIAGVKKRTVIDWEKGQSSPTTVQLFALSEKGVDVQYVQTGRTKLERRLDALKKATESVISLPIPEDKQIILRDILYATDAEDYELLAETMNGYASSNLTAVEKDLLAAYRKAGELDRAIIERAAVLASAKEEK